MRPSMSLTVTDESTAEPNPASVLNGQDWTLIRAHLDQCEILFNGTPANLELFGLAIARAAAEVNVARSLEVTEAAS